MSLNNDKGCPFFTNTYVEGGVSNQLAGDFFSYKTGGFYWYKNIFNLNSACDIWI